MLNTDTIGKSLLSKIYLCFLNIDLLLPYVQKREDQITHAVKYVNTLTGKPSSTVIQCLIEIEEDLTTTLELQGRAR